MKEVKAFGCDYCGMTNRTKGNVKRHEEMSCKKSPNRKTCRNCSSLDFDEDDGYFCDKIEEYISHPVNINMDCKHFERRTAQAR